MLSRFTRVKRYAAKCIIKYSVGNRFVKISTVYYIYSWFNIYLEKSGINTIAVYFSPQIPAAHDV